MTSKSQQCAGRDDVRSTLNVAIEDLNHVKDNCNIAPAQAAFGSVSDLLAATGVRLLLFYDDQLPVDLHPGYHGRQTRLC